MKQEYFKLPVISRLDENWPIEPYAAIPRDQYMIPHWGQRKLLIAEIAFLTKYGHRADVVVYAGAAPGSHIAQLASLFPRHMFRLYDPREFAVELTDYKNIQTFQEYFTDEIAEYESTRRTLFICDIRTSDSDFEGEIDKNLQQQRRWCKIMKPRMASLKFRLPFVVSKTDKTEYEYFDGDIRLQAWVGRDSAETRLWTNCQTTKIYNCLQYEGQMFHYNLNLRLGSSGISEDLSQSCIDGCNDCAIEWNTWRKYYTKMKIATDIIEVIKNTPQSLCIGPHGKYPQLRAAERIEKLREETSLFYKTYHQNEDKRNELNEGTKRIVTN